MSIESKLPPDGSGTKYMDEQCGWGKLEVPIPTPFALEQRRDALRVVLFGSAVRGQAVLNRLIRASRENPDKLAITGVCTDDVFGGKISRKRRLWQYIERGDARFLEDYVQQTARYAGIPTFTGSVKSDYFQEELLDKHWKPDVILMATFGQLVPPEVFERPTYGMYNLHPSDLSRGKHPGPNPFKGVVDAGESITRMSLHHVDAGFDTGHVVGVSPEIYLRNEDGSYPANIRMHEQTAPAAARMAEMLAGRIAETRERVGTMDFESAFSNIEKTAFMEPLKDRPVDHMPLHLREYLFRTGMTELL